MSNNIINDRIIFIGIGIFLWLCLGSFSIIFQDIFQNLSLRLGLSPIFIMIAKELMKLIVYLSGILFVIKIIKAHKFRNLHIFFSLLILLLIGQLLQFSITLVMGEFFDENYLINLNEYYNYTRSDVIFQTIPAIVEFILYIVMGIIFYKNWNKFEHFDIETDQELNKIGKE